MSLTQCVQLCLIGADTPKARKDGMKMQPIMNAPVAAPTGRGRPKVDKIMHPALQPDENGKATVLLEAWPDDYKTTVHKPLLVNNFKDSAIFYNGKADRLQKVVDSLREKATESAKLGGIPQESKSAAKKMLKLQKQLDDLRSEMSASGVDVEAMLKLLAAKQAAAAAPAPTAAA